MLLALLLAALSTSPEPAESYTCTMHPEVHAPSPGPCPVCGMALVPEGHHHHGGDAESGQTEPNPMEDPLGLGMSREGSGTAWQPDSTPLYMHHFHVAGWMLMLHYNAAGGFDDQTGPRGDRQWMSTNWLMGMGQRYWGTGLFQARLMLSLEPLTTGGAPGYPLLLQTGETAGGVALHDRQHPHDLFMELAVKYNQAVTSQAGLELYLAPSGEPALGPVAFPHRVSAMYDPLAAITHHWQDSTHISFGVVTLGVYTRRCKLEGSWFNGREPDENRYDFDFRRLDSYSARLSCNPTPNESLQVSYGYLASPEALTPTQSQQRVTASGTFNWPLGEGRNWATTFVWGRDIPSVDAPSNSALLESSLEWGADVVFGRLEWVTKSGADLVIPGSDSAAYQVGAATLGYTRNFPAVLHVVPGAGACLTLAFVPPELEGLYGGVAPLSGMVFLHLRPEELGGHGP